MDWQAIGAIGEALGGVAVLATLVYLAVQVKQAKALLSSTTQQARTDRNIKMAEYILDHDDLLTLMVKDESPEELDESESARVRYLYSMTMRHNEDLHFQRELGHLDDHTWDAALNSMRVITSPNRIAFWRQIEPTFRKPFRDLVQSIIDGDT